MSDLFEVRIHGRAGQGAKTGGQILAYAAFFEGKTVQAFPEYGSERRGAPTVAYTRISTKEIRTHEPILEPDAVIVLDETYIYTLPVTKGLKENGVLIVNTIKSAEEVKKVTKFNGKVFTVDATGISLSTVGRDAPNIPTLGALVKVSNILSLDSLKKAIEEMFLEKLGENLTKKNIDALKRGYEEVK
ncbi:MAG: 2-oxoacid:acceptor oxidoreductase family protein [Caldisericia bacterium]|nr:2-oxoacid:acceptor oxidoreductase family protein [Caldisericia bacterium]